MLQTPVILALAAVLMPAILYGVGAEASCPEACTKEYDPVCVSVTTEFGNQCMMNGAECIMGRAGFVVSGAQNGSCSSKRRNAGFIRRAAVKRDDDSDCPPNACTLQYEPVCGTYTGTFSNSCVKDTVICRLEEAMSAQLTVTSESSGSCPSAQK